MVPTLERAHRVFAVDGDGRGNTQDLIGQGPVHAVHELAGIWRKGFHITALAFGVQGIERQRRFARTAHAGHHGNAVQGDIEIEPLQIVLPGPANANAWFHFQLCPIQLHL
jgi:hypothetical protein